jgi:hypothetical protein
MPASFSGPSPISHARRQASGGARGVEGRGIVERDRSDVSNFDARDARDAMVEYVVETRRHAVAWARHKLGLPSDARSIRRSCERHVRAAFSVVGGSYDRPTRESARMAMQELRRSARALGHDDPGIDLPPTISRHLD